jgi:16S rRNA (uracil1498-N3)-methyltransferase
MSYYFVSNINTLQIQGQQTERLFSMRIEKDDIIKLTDLNGLISTVKITNLNKKQAQIDYQIIENKFIAEADFWNSNTIQTKENLFHATLDKLYMEKLYEIIPHSGFRNIYFFEAEFSQKQNINFERLEKILIRSLEQSQSVYRPQIKFIKNTEFVELINKIKPGFLNCESENQKSNHNSNDTNNTVNSFLVGPEGGWSQKEVKFFKELDLMQINLGSIIYPAWLVSNKI